MSTHVPRIRGLLLAGLAVLLVPLAIQAYERIKRLDGGLMPELMLGASVSIRTLSHVRTDHVGDSVWEAGQGSGFLVSSTSCEVWTNHHVIDGAALVEVFPHGWRDDDGIPAKVVGSTPRADFAILRMSRCDGMTPAPLGDSDTSQTGEVTFAVGNPLGQNPDSITRGIISHTERYIHGSTAFLQTDAAINPGNSGGALYNTNGEVIGMSTAIASVKGVNSGIGYAVPVNVLKGQAQRLRNGTPSFGDAGIDEDVSNLSPEQASLLRVPQGNAAIMLLEDPEGGPAEGVLKAHDVIYAIQGKSIRNAAHAKDMISDYDPGQVLSFNLVRAGEPVSVDVTLAAGVADEDRPQPDHYHGLLGMTLEMWSEMDDERGRFETPVITQVKSLGPAHRARIMSSQKTLVFGPSGLTPHMLDVKTVTGVVIDGVYAPVSQVSQVEDAARRAHRSGQAILLEVALWSRENPMDRSAELAHIGTRFFTLEPRTSAMERNPDDEVGLIASASML